jgi:putative membrane protein
LQQARLKPVCCLPLINHALTNEFSIIMMNWTAFCGGGIMMFIWIIVIILVIVALVKWISGSQKQKPNGDSAMDILRQRYAHRDITKEEFQERKQNLNQ